MNYILSAAVALAASGVPVFPCRRDKSPACRGGFTAATTDPAEVRKLFSVSSAELIGVPTGKVSGIDAIDVDPRHGGNVWYDLHWDKLFTRIHNTRSGGQHVLFRHANGVGCSTSRVAPGIDVRGDGGYICWWPAAGFPLALEVHLDALSEWPAWALSEALGKAAPRVSSPDLAGNLADVASAMRAIPNRGPSNWDHWNTVGLALFAATKGSDDGHELWHEWSERHEYYDSDATDARWDHFCTSPPNKIGAGSIYHWASQADPSWHRPSAAPTGGKEFGPLAPLPERAFQRGNRHFPLNQDGAALAFVAEHGSRLRYCHQFGCWLKWTGAIWQRDQSDLAFEWARELSREMADDSVRKEFAKVSHASAVERFARSDRDMVVDADDLDRDPMLLGTPGGTVDLRTGTLLPARPNDLITQAVAVAPAESACCPTWLRFLHEATGGDADLVGFLQRFGGYTLTGDTREHALMFIHGDGGNGKSVWLNTLAGIMGSYAKTAALDALTATKSERHPTDVAMLHGARLVSASETEEGRSWAEAKVKALTGGDPITARFMRQDFFTFKPRFKLIVIGNHQPALDNPDAASKRRFNIVPFVHKPDTPDKQLEDRLRREWPGILRWLITGCLAWQQDGLRPPQVVTDATAKYFTEQDRVGQWIDQFCDLGGRGLNAPSSELFSSWSFYAHSVGEKPNTSKWLVDALRRHGCEIGKIKGVRSVEGIRLRPVNSTGGLS